MADDVLRTDEYTGKQKLVLNNSAMVRFRRGANHVGLLVEGNPRVFDMWIEGHNETIIKVKDFADVKSLTTNTPEYLLITEDETTANIDFNKNGLLSFEDFSTDTPDFIEIKQPDSGEGVEINFTGSVESEDEGFITIEESGGVFIINFVAEITTNTPAALEINKTDTGWTIDYVKVDKEITTTTPEKLRITDRTTQTVIDFIAQFEGENGIEVTEDNGTYTITMPDGADEVQVIDLNLQENKDAISSDLNNAYSDGEFRIYKCDSTYSTILNKAVTNGFYLYSIGINNPTDTYSAATQIFIEIYYTPTGTLRQTGRVWHRTILNGTYGDWELLTNQEIPIAFFVKRTGGATASFTDASTIEFAGGTYFQIINRKELAVVTFAGQTISYASGYFITYNKSTQALGTLDMALGLTFDANTYIVGIMGPDQYSQPSIKMFGDEKITYVMPQYVVIQNTFTGPFTFSVGENSTNSAQTFTVLYEGGASNNTKGTWYKFDDVTKLSKNFVTEVSSTTVDTSYRGLASYTFNIPTDTAGTFAYTIAFEEITATGAVKVWSNPVIATVS